MSVKPHPKYLNSSFKGPEYDTLITTYNNSYTTQQGVNFGPADSQRLTEFKWKNT